MGVLLGKGVVVEQDFVLTNTIPFHQVTCRMLKENEKLRF